MMSENHSQLVWVLIFVLIHGASDDFNVMMMIKNPNPFNGLHGLSGTCEVHG